MSTKLLFKQSGLLAKSRAEEVLLVSSNNPTKPDSFNTFNPAQNNSTDEVTLQDLGIFDADVPPPSAFQPTTPGSSSNGPVAPPASSPAGLQAVALRDPALLDNSEQEFVEIEMLPGENLEGKLACAICYLPYYPPQLTVVSKERLNFEAAVVVCPECLQEMQTEVRRRTAGADLTLGIIWGGVTTIIITVIMGWLIWSQRTGTTHTWWEWFCFFLAFVPGWLIGKAVFIGVGRKTSRRQQWLAVVLTAFSVYTQFYITQLAFDNFIQDIRQADGHSMVWQDPVAMTTRLLPSIIGAGPLLGLVIIAAAVIGILTAWFASQGPRLYTRPFVQPENVKNSRWAKTRQFLNV